jgi:diketogulonate reductase-like aldo/keto reductase
LTCSNFLPEHIDRVVEATGVVPAVNQLETHPYFQQRNVRDYHENLGIKIESYSPLGHGEVLEDDHTRSDCPCRRSYPCPSGAKYRAVAARR